MARLFKLFEDELECVVLNGCYSYEQAAAIAEHVPHVIGMRRTVNERAAIEFAVGFYDALGNGRPVKFAFEFGKSAMELAGAGDSEMPVLWPDAFADEPVSVLPKSGLKRGAPFPRVRLPENYVDRPDALRAVKDLLLAEDERTLVVSAISGLGGLGKSVLATALVLDKEVRSRFADGILWVTLGQKPDLLTMLGDWIRELDKSRESFSANTLEAASRYLGNLLAERRMLLVVDDVWNAAHAEWFRVGGAECRVLATTREAQLDGAEYYPLDLMSRENALQMVRQKLGNKWKDSQEQDFQAFAKSLGYLPLALDLVTNHVLDGLSWAELQTEFETERRAVALELLETSECLDDLDEQQQRQYSLRACFNLSLKRLKSDQLQQFAWFGVLPEDVNLTAQVAKMLWGISQFKAKKTLIDFRKRSLLTDGSSNLEEEPTYRVHDLMHDMARNLIEQGNLVDSVDKEYDLSGKRQQNLILAHRQFLNRYRDICTDSGWHALPKDSYIHRHLTWHLEQGDWVDEIHRLMEMSDTQGRNAWFEACDRIGQPAIFVEDVARGWRLAEESFDHEKSRSIVLQCRYALITVTLNSLIKNLPIGMMAEFVKQDFWTVEHAWAYVEQMNEEEKIIEAIQTLAPYLSGSLFKIAVNKVCALQDEAKRADILSVLANLNGSNFNKLLKATWTIQDEVKRTDTLEALIKIDGADFDKLLEAVWGLQNKYLQVSVLIKLGQQDESYFNAALEKMHEIQDEGIQASILAELAKQKGINFDKLLEATRRLQDKLSQANILSRLSKQDKNYFNEALETTRELQDESNRADILRELAKHDGIDCNKLLEEVQELQDESNRANILRELAKHDGIDCDKLLEEVYSLEAKYWRAIVLSELAKQDRSFSYKALEAVQEIQDESNRANVLRELAKHDGIDCDKLLKVAQRIQDESNRANVLRELAKHGRSYFDRLLELDSAKLISD
ncbi:MAG: NB-ARC domain-containing protein [Cyanobacteria bacterium P01_F01_bin.86]